MIITTVFEIYLFIFYFAADIFKYIVFNKGSVWKKYLLKLFLMVEIDSRSILVQVMAWCRQAKNHYLG